MNRNILKTAIRSIKASLGRYLAIVSIVALGAGFYSGLISSQPAMRITAADYVYDRRMYDYRLLTALGLTEEDLSSFSELDWVEQAEGAYFTDAYLKVDAVEAPYKIMSLTEKVSLPYLTEGRYPENENECLADDARFGKDSIGKAVLITESNDEDTLELLRVRSFTIVGLAKSPRFMSTQRGSTSLGSGKLEGFIIVEPEAFDSEVYHEILLFCGIENAFTDDYTREADSHTDALEELLGARGKIRYQKLRAEADEELMDARRELDDGWQEYYDGEKEAEEELENARIEIEDGEKEIKDGRIKIENGKEQLYSGLVQLESARKELEAGKAELKSKEKELRDGQAKLDDAFSALNDQKAQLSGGRAQLDQAEAQACAEAEAAAKQQYAAVFTGISELETWLASAEETDPEYAVKAQQLAGLKAQGDAILSGAREAAMSYFAEAEAEYSASAAQLTAYENQLNDSQATLTAGKQQLEAGKAELAAGERELDGNEALIKYNYEQLYASEDKLDEAEKDLEQGRKDLEQARLDAAKELADGLEELEDGEREYSDAVKEVEEKLTLETHVLTRKANSGCATFKNDVTIIGAAAKAFPVFFILIAAFVCITTMTRMINEERTQIGTMKALGYSRVTVMSKYLIYSCSAAALGCVAGLALGLAGIPRAIWTAYCIIYNYTALKAYFSPTMCAAVFFVAVAGTAAVTVYSCRLSLAEKPASLMRPRTPAAGKRILVERIKPLWSRLSFLTKVMLRNAFRYPTRVLMMLLGIGGCTALIIACMGVGDSISKVLEYQYGEIFLYDMCVNLSENKAPDKEGIDEMFSAAESYVGVFKEEVTLSYEDGSKDVNLIVSSAEELEGTIDIHNKKGALSYPEKGEVIISQKAADTLNIKVGDEVSLSSEKTGTLRLRVSGICENYLGIYAYASTESMPELGINTVLASVGENAPADKLAAELRARDEVSYVSLVEDEKTLMNDSVKSLDMVILLVVACAGALTFITIFNLTNINIMERIREIATVKVLGFHRDETAMYILNENLLLSFLGVLTGVPLGKLLHKFIMDIIQVESMSYDVRVSLMSYIISVIVSLLFSVVANLLMMPNINRVNMAESLKSVE